MSPGLRRVTLCTRCPVRSSGTVFPIPQTGSSRCIPVWVLSNVVVVESLDCCWHINGRDLALGWSAARSGCDHWPLWRIILCKGQHYEAGLWYPLSPALECVTCGSGWVVFWHGLNKVCLFICHKSRPHVRWEENPTLYITLPLSSSTSRALWIEYIFWLLHFNSLPHLHNILKISTFQGDFED